MSDVSDQWWSGYASAVVAPRHELALAHRLQRWSAKVSMALAGHRPGTDEPAPSATLDADDWSREFALDTAVAGARPSNTSEKARKKVERHLAWLDEEWHVLHVVEEGVDLESPLIAPA